MNLLHAIKRLLFHKPAHDPEQALRAVQSLIGYQFRDETVLSESLSHRSYTHGDRDDDSSNERLEFLGDSVLGLVIAEQLYREHPDMQEGELTQTKALLVSEATLAEIGLDIGLNTFLLLAAEEERTGGRERPSIIADAFEAVIGAVFLDGGLDAARDLVLRIIYTHKENLITDASRRNFKGELLELGQARAAGVPRYDVVLEEGPDHEKVFHVEVFIGSTRYGTGTGSSKKEAEQNAAAVALEAYRKSRQ